MTERIVITFAARSWTDLPALTDADSISDGTPVPMPAGLTGTIQLGRRLAFKSAAGPDEWRAVIQVVVMLSGGLATSLLGNWLHDRLKEIEPEPLVIDRGVHVHEDVRVFIGQTEIETTGRAPIEAIVREALSAPSSIDDLPPQLRRQEAIAAGMTDEEWVRAQIEKARLWREEVDRRMEAAEDRDRE
jgi:hypothetical protein